MKVMGKEESGSMKDFQPLCREILHGENGLNLYCREKMSDNGWSGKDMYTEVGGDDDIWECRERIWDSDYLS